MICVMVIHRKSSEVRKSSGNNVKKPTPAVGNNAIVSNKFKILKL